MDLVDDGFCIIQFIEGPDGPLSDYVHVEANSGYERHTGIPGIVGKTVFDVSPQDGAEWVKIYGEVLRSGKPIRFEREFVVASRYIEVSATRVEPVEKAQVAVLFRDITQRKTAELALRDSELRASQNARHVARALAAGAIIGTWVWTLDSERFDLDEGFSLAMGLDPNAPQEGLTIAKIAARVHPEDRPTLMEAIDRAITDGTGYAHQFRVKRSDGVYHWVEANGRLEAGFPRIFAGVLMDLDERLAIVDERDRATAEVYRLNETLEKRVQEQTARIMAQEEALRQAHKMEAVGQLTGGLAHDFNNLLTAITGSLELAEARLRQGRTDEIGHFMRTAQSSAERAATLTQRLLAFSRRQSLAPAPTDLGALVQGMQDLIRHSIGPQISIDTRVDKAAWPAMIDPNQLENALLNLCINARDAMPDGGTIEISISNATLAEADGDLAAGDYLRLAVRDTGTGMSDQALQKAFDPYFTTKPSGKGTGLGLSMVYGYARQSGGIATLSSAQGAGTTVVLMLPRSTQAAEVCAPPVTLTAEPDGSDLTVLVVDDEVLLRMVVKEALTDAGFAILEAGTGAEGLEVLQAHPEVDILLTDVGLPGGMSGRDLAVEVLKLRPEMKVMFMTGYDQDATGSAAMDHAEVLLKPFAFDEMVGRVSRLAHGA